MFRSIVTNLCTQPTCTSVGEQEVQPLSWVPMQNDGRAQIPVRVQLPSGNFISQLVPIAQNRKSIIPPLLAFPFVLPSQHLYYSFKRGFDFCLVQAGLSRKPETSTDAKLPRLSDPWAPLFGATVSPVMLLLQSFAFSFSLPGPCAPAVTFPPCPASFLLLPSRSRHDPPASLLWSSV